MDAIIPPCLAIVPKRTLASIFQSTSQPLPDGLDSIDDDDQQQITVALRSSSWSPSTAQQAVLTFRAPRRIRMLANSDATTSVSIQKSQLSTDPTAEPPLKRPKLGKAPKSPLTVTSSHGYSEWERAVLAIMRETRLPSNDDDDRLVLTVQSNEALGVALMSVLKSSLESLDSDPAAASRRTAHRIIGQAETHLTQLSELLAEPYEGDESSAMQPLVRRLLDAANAVIKPLFALHDIAKPNRCGQNQSQTDGPAAPNTSGPVGRWWNGIGPGESVRPDFVSANATADVKVSIQKLREAFGLLHHTSQGMQLKVATDGALSVGVVDPDDKNPDWEQVPTSLFVQAVVQMQCKRKTWGLVLDWDIACLIHQSGHRTYEIGPIFHRSSLANRPSIFQVVATLLLDLSPLDQNVRPDWFVDLGAVYALTEVKPVPKLAPPAGSAGTETKPSRSTPIAMHAGPEPTAMQPPDPPARNSLASFDLDAPASVTPSTGMSHLPRATISGRSDGLPDGRMSHTSGVAGGTMGGGGTSRTQLPPTTTTPPRSWRVLAQSWPSPRSPPGDSTTVEEPDSIIGRRRLLPDMATIANPPDEHGDVLVGARHRFGDASLLAAVRDTRVLDREAAWDDSFLHQLASCLVPSALTVRSSARLQRDGATTIVGGPERAVPVTTIHTYRIEAVNTAQLCLGPSSQTERRRLTSPLIPPRSPVLPDVLELDHVDAMGHYTLTFCASLTRGNQSSLPVIAKITRPARYDMPPVDPFTAPAAPEQTDWDHQDDDNDGSYVSEDRAASREVVDELSNEIVMYRALGKCDDDLDPSSTVEATPATSSTTTAASVPTLRGAFVARPDRWKGCAMDLVILVTDDAGREVTPEEMARKDIERAWDATFWSRGMVHGDPASRHIRVMYPIPIPSNSSECTEGRPVFRFIDLGRARCMVGPEDIEREKHKVWRLLGLLDMDP